MSASSTPEPPPTPNGRPAIVDLVIEDLRERKEFGIRKYGTPLQAFNGRSPVVDRYQELLDAVLYCKQQLEEGDIVMHALELACGILSLLPQYRAASPEQWAKYFIKIATEERKLGL